MRGLAGCFCCKKNTFYKLAVLAEKSLFVFKLNTQTFTDFIDQRTEAEFKELNIYYAFQRSFSTDLSKLAQISSSYDLGSLKHGTVIYIRFTAAFCCQTNEKNAKAKNCGKEGTQEQSRQNMPKSICSTSRISCT